MRFKVRIKPSVLNRVNDIFFSLRDNLNGNWTMFTSLIAFRDIIKRNLSNWRWTWLWICIIFQYRCWCIELKTIVLEYKALIVSYFVIITNYSRDNTLQYGFQEITQNSSCRSLSLILLSHKLFLNHLNNNKNLSKSCLVIMRFGE